MRGVAVVVGHGLAWVPGRASAGRYHLMRFVVHFGSATLASEHLSVVVAMQERSPPPASAPCLVAVDATVSKAVGADEGVPIRAIAEVIGRHLDLRVVSIAPGDAGSASPGWPASSRPTRRPQARSPRELLGMEPYAAWAHRRPRPTPLLRAGPRRGRLSEPPEPGSTGSPEAGSNLMIFQPLVLTATKLYILRESYLSGPHLADWLRDQHRSPRLVSSKRCERRLQGGLATY